MAQSIQKCFSVLGNDLRMEILKALEKKSMTVTELTDKLKAERTNVSHSLSMLKNCKFVKDEKKGRERVYSLEKSVLGDLKRRGNLLELMEFHMKHQCGKKCAEALK
ncbi:MAG: metalloregulator ArsR/SmtB family transcription factor [Candidatus Diapherotrites archaeon]|nr:metalloregulator ArsR/SmtB family transcription factor [Candidatus Diapherotrites archaeon]